MESDATITPTMNDQQKQYRNISVFATLGRILFFIAFTLKIYYLLSYRKHKKLNEKLTVNSYVFKYNRSDFILSLQIIKEKSQGPGM